MDNESQDTKFGAPLVETATSYALPRTYTRFDVDPETGRASTSSNSVPRTYSRPTPAERGKSQRITNYRTLSIGVHETQTTHHAPANKQVKDITELEWHTLSVNDVLKRLTTAPSGLDSTQVTRRQEQGKNVMSKPPSNLAKKIFGYIFGGFGSLLLVSSILCFIAWKPLGEPAPQISNLALAIVLLVVVVFSAVFNAYQDFTTGRAMASISGLMPSTVSVIRDGGNVSKVDPSELVLGDIVEIKLGDKIGADLRLISCGNDLRFERSILTGESDAIPGTIDATSDNFLETKNIAMQGTLCVAGSGTGVVVQIGDNSVIGRIAKLSSKPKTGRTTLEQEIFRFVCIIASLASVTALLILILWAAWLRPKHPGFITTSGIIVNIVSVMVSFIPEGLPICVTLSIAKVASTLSKHKVLCKTLSTVETLGSVSVICSDKTGTLTLGNMTVTTAALLEDEMTTSEARERVVKGGPGADGPMQLQMIATLCNDSKFEAEDVTLDPANKKINGDATDSAIFRFGDILRSATVTRSEWIEVYSQAFNSKTKYAIKLLRPVADISPSSASRGIATLDFLLAAKGAPDVLLKHCSSVLDPKTGESLPLSEDRLVSLRAIQEKWASRGQRVLLLTRRIIAQADSGLADLDPLSQAFADVMTNLTRDLEIIGLVGLMDPPRHDTRETVEVCRGAGVRFFMVTGDFPLTAVSIAAQSGIVTDASTIHHLSDVEKTIQHSEEKEKFPLVKQAIVLDGTDIQKMTDAHWEVVCQYQEIVFARTSPEQKLRIVKEFQQRDAIVAMTGDGVNDAPSLKQANIGIAMGEGSEVAKEAADMVILGTFSSIVQALLYGRLCFQNLSKTILFLLPAGSFSELMPVLINVLFGLPQVLSSLQMILICVVTDVAPALSLCLEKPEADLLTLKPRNIKKDRLVNVKTLGHAYFFAGLIESLCAMSMAFWHFQRRGIPFSGLWLAYGGLSEAIDPNFYAQVTYEAQSIYFFTLVLLQWFNLLSVRTRRLSIFQHPPIGKKDTRNLYIFPAMACALVLAIVFSYIPFFQKAFLTRGIPVQHFFLPLAFGLGLLTLDELRKLAVRKYPGSVIAKMAW